MAGERATAGQAGTSSSQPSRNHPRRWTISLQSEPAVEGTGSLTPQHSLIKGGYVITMDDDLGDLPMGDVLIDQDKIVRVAPEITPPDGTHVVDARERVVLPGLIDTHEHSWQGLVAGVSHDDTFGEYFARTLDDLGTRFTPEYSALGVQLSALAGAMAGRTTVLHWDHSAVSTEHVAANIAALEQSGVRAVEAYGPPASSPHWFDSLGGPHPDDVRAIAKHHASSGGMVSMALAIRGPEFSTMERVTADVELARELGVRVTMHAGIPGFFQRFNSPQLMAEAGLLGDDVTFVHCNAMEVADFERIRLHGAHVSSSPEAEMQMGFGCAPLGAMLKAGVSPTVSVDIPSGMSSDLLVQARFLLQRHREQYHAEVLAETGAPAQTLPIKARDVLSYLTVNAAAALGLADTIGSLTPGKLADLIMIDTTDLVTFLRAPEALVVQAAHPGAISDVMVNGRFVKRSGQLTALDPERLRELQEAAIAANTATTARS